MQTTPRKKSANKAAVRQRHLNKYKRAHRRDIRAWYVKNSAERSSQRKGKLTVSQVCATIVGLLDLFPAAQLLYIGGRNQYTASVINKLDKSGADVYSMSGDSRSAGTYDRVLLFSSLDADFHTIAHLLTGLPLNNKKSLRLCGSIVFMMRDETYASPDVKNWLVSKHAQVRALPGHKLIACCVKRGG